MEPWQPPSLDFTHWLLWIPGLWPRTRMTLPASLLSPVLRPLSCHGNCTITPHLTHRWQVIRLLRFISHEKILRSKSPFVWLNKYPMDSGSLENAVYYSIWWPKQGVLRKVLKGKERGRKKAREMHMDSIQRRTRALQDLVQCGSSLLLTYAKEFGLYPESSMKPWKHWNAGVTGSDLHIRAQFPLILKFSTSII